MEAYLAFGQDHLLAIVALGITIVLIYLYLIERDTGIKLSKKYRNSIYEAQSKVFLNATQHLISGHKDLAIKEFLNAVDINRETLETYFALGGLFRSNGEIDKAISIHRSLIARENITEPTRLRALKELAMDFDKGGFIDKAIETYKDVFAVNPDEEEVLLSICRIYESVEDWNNAYEYRLILSKVGRDNQADTISHILVEKAKRELSLGNITLCGELLSEAFRYAPSVSAKILRLKYLLITGAMEGAQTQLIEILKEHPHYTSFVFVSLKEKCNLTDEARAQFIERQDHLLREFLNMEDKELNLSSPIVLSRVRLLKEQENFAQAYRILREWMEISQKPTEIMRVEYAKLLIELGKTEKAVEVTKSLLENWQKSVTRHYCSECGYNSDEIFWRCPQCYEWETIQFRWIV